MKTNCAKPGHFRQHLARLVGASALGLLALAATSQAAAPKSPVGTWDCVMSGAREGLASMTFHADGTFTNIEVLVPKPAKAPAPNNDNRGGDGVGRFPGDSSGGSVTNKTLPPHTDLFGSQETSGLWTFDIRGRVIGSFYEISEPTYATNAITPPSTNLDLTLYEVPTTNASSLGDEFCVTRTIGTNSAGLYTNLVSCYVITANAITNQLSFVGTVVPGKRLTLVVSSPAGKVTFSGVPNVPLTDISGNWYGSERVGQLWYTEFFTLTPSTLGPNIYAVDGSGPGYTYSGMAMLSPQKKLGFSLGIYPLFGAELLDGPQEVRAVVGPLNLKRLGGTLHGLEGPGTDANHRLTFSVQHQ
jgi:hypothetical protein